MKTTTIKLIFMSMIFILLSTQCEKIAMDKRYPLHLKNNSAHSIRYYISTGYNDTPVYPDTKSAPTVQDIGNSYKMITIYQLANIIYRSTARGELLMIENNKLVPRRIH